MSAAASCDKIEGGRTLSLEISLETVDYRMQKEVGKEKEGIKKERKPRDATVCLSVPLKSICLSSISLLLSSPLIE